jgi:hypothetical protein
MLVAGRWMLDGIVMGVQQSLQDPSLGSSRRPLRLGTLGVQSGRTATCPRTRHCEAIEDQLKKIAVADAV